MTAVVGIVSSGLIVLILVFAFTGYLYKAKRSCFKETNTAVKPKGSLRRKTCNKVYSK